MSNAVPAEGEDGEGSVRFMGLRVRQGNPPKVVAEDSTERCVSSAVDIFSIQSSCNNNSPQKIYLPDISIVLYGFIVVEDKVSRNSIQVEQDS